MNMKIIDLKDMPNASSKVENGMDSVSKDKVFIDNGVVSCKVHGAMLRVSKDGIYRCPACNEGCYLERRLKAENKE